MMNAALVAASAQEPLKGLIAKGKAFAATPGGVVALTEAATALITAAVLAKQPLPVTTFTFDLGVVAKDLEGVTITPTWKGPANDPTEAGVKVVVAPKSWPVTFSGGFKTGSTTPNTGEAGIGFKPGGPLSLSAGFKASDKPFPLGPLDPRRTGAQFEGSAAADLKLPGGANLGAKFTADTASNVSVTIGLTVQFGAASAPKRRTSDEGELRRSPDPASGTQQRSVAPSVYGVLRDPGRPLPGIVRAEMSHALGADLSHVRTHADEAGARSARDVGASAYTVGHHVVFGAGRFDPERLPAVVYSFTSSSTSSSTPAKATHRRFRDAACRAPARSSPMASSNEKPTAVFIVTTLSQQRSARVSMTFDVRSQIEDIGYVSSLEELADSLLRDGGTTSWSDDGRGLRGAGRAHGDWAVTSGRYDSTSTRLKGAPDAADADLSGRIRAGDPERSPHDHRCRGPRSPRSSVGRSEDLSTTPRISTTLATSSASSGGSGPTASWGMPLPTSSAMAVAPPSSFACFRRPPSRRAPPSEEVGAAPPMVVAGRGRRPRGRCRLGPGPAGGRGGGTDDGRTDGRRAEAQGLVTGKLGDVLDR